MKRIRAWLVTIIVLAIAIRVLWWALQPLILPAIIVLVIVMIIGSIYYRRTKW